MTATLWRKYRRAVGLGVSACACGGLAYLGLGARGCCGTCGHCKHVCVGLGHPAGLHHRRIVHSGLADGPHLAQEHEQDRALRSLLGELRGAAVAFLLVLVLALISLFMSYSLLQAGIAVSAGAMASGVLMLTQAGWKFFRVIALA